MKVLLLSQGRKLEDQPDYNRSFAKMTEVLNIPFVSYVEKYGGEAFYNEIVRINDEFRPDLVFFQFFHSASPGNPTHCVQALHSSSRNKPLVFGSIGDAFDTGILKIFGRPLPRHTLQLAACADAFFSTSMGNVAEELVRHGAKNLVFLPNAFCPMHFQLSTCSEKSSKKYDVVMLGSYCPIIVKRFLTAYCRGMTRKKMVNLLAKRYGSGFGLFGRGWNNSCAQGSVAFKDQVDVFKLGRVAVDVPAQVMDRYYTSDRAFFIAGSGTPLVMRYVPGLDKMFKDRLHVYFADTIEDIPNVCQMILSLPEDEAMERKRATLELIKQRHMIDNRVDTIISVAEAIKSSASEKQSMGVDSLRLWHFLPDVDLKDERKYAVKNWRG